MIDAHVHFWGTEVAAADWLADERTASIRRPVGIAEYADAAAGSGVEGIVVVTAEQSVAESARLVAECAAEPLVRGVVGWADLANGFVAAELDGLVGIRHSVITEPPGWLRRHDVRAGIAAFARTGLVLELLVAARDLADVAACATEHPALPIVVDHLGDPSVPDGTWMRGIRALASHENVRVKLSGDHATAATAGLVLDALGPSRVLVGSDWPVSTVRQPLDVEFESLVSLLGGLASDERDRVLTGTAVATYRLAS
jgi:L-fuconolactonase